MDTQTQQTPQQAKLAQVTAAAVKAKAKAKAEGKVKTSGELSEGGKAKGKAGNKLATLQAQIDKAYFHMYPLDPDSKDGQVKEIKDEKLAFSWMDIFNDNKEIDQAYDTYKAEQDKYKKGVDSISQRFMSMARIAKTPDKFEKDYKHMVLAWKEATKQTTVKQSIRDAKSILMRAWGAGVKVTNYGSVERVKQQLATFKKVERTTGVKPTGLMGILNEFNELYLKFEAIEDTTHIEQMEAYLKKGIASFERLHADMVGDAPIKVEQNEAASIPADKIPTKEQSVSA